MFWAGISDFLEPFEQSKNTTREQRNELSETMARIKYQEHHHGTPQDRRGRVKFTTTRNGRIVFTGDYATVLVLKNGRSFGPSEEGKSPTCLRHTNVPQVG